MKVYIIHRDIPYEMGDVFGVYSTEEKAEVAKKKFMKDDKTTDPDDWSIEVWEVDDTFLGRTLTEQE